jgi:hypothetical protein
MATRLTEMNPDSRNYLKAVGVEDSVIEKNFFVK